MPSLAHATILRWEAGVTSRTWKAGEAKLTAERTKLPDSSFREFPNAIFQITSADFLKAGTWQGFPVWFCKFRPPACPFDQPHSKDVPKVEPPESGKPVWDKPHSSSITCPVALEKKGRHTTAFVIS